MNVQVTNAAGDTWRMEHDEAWSIIWIMRRTRPRKRLFMQSAQKHRQRTQSARESAATEHGRTAARRSQVRTGLPLGWHSPKAPNIPPPTPAAPPPSVDQAVQQQQQDQASLRNAGRVLRQACSPARTRRRRWVVLRNYSETRPCPKPTTTKRARFVGYRKRCTPSAGTSTATGNRLLNTSCRITGLHDDMDRRPAPDQSHLRLDGAASA